MLSEKQRVMEYHNHPNENVVEHIAGGWWRIWNHQYHHIDEGYHLSLMSDGVALAHAAILYTGPGHTGTVLALKNTDYLLDDWTEERSPSMYDWANEWMGENPIDIREHHAPTKPVQLNGSSIEETFTRGDTEDFSPDPLSGYLTTMNNGGSEWTAELYLPPDQSEEIIHAYTYR